MATRNAAALKKIGEWVKRFERVASPQFQGQLTKELTLATLEFVDESFEKERSPTGKAWAKKKEPDGNKILSRSDALRSSIRGRVTGKGSFKVMSTKEYGAYHNEGRRGPWTIKPKKPGGTLAFMSGGKMRYAKSVKHPGYPARQFIPSSRRIPARWLRTYIKITIAKYFRVVARGKKK